VGWHCSAALSFGSRCRRKCSTSSNAGQISSPFEEQIEDLTAEIKKMADEEASQELQAWRYKLYKERQRLTLEELKKRRQSQPEITRPAVLTNPSKAIATALSSTASSI
jgi:hypothetical protein